MARVLRSRSRRYGLRLRDEDFASCIAESAAEHFELVSLVADGRVSAVDDLLRHHISPVGAG